MKKGLLVIVSSPSGGGKDAVINALLTKLPNAGRLITTTTRAPRVGEKNGAPYYFITVDEFKKKIAEDAFIEHNLYAENYYGTEKAELTRAQNAYSVVFTNIEVTGRGNFVKQHIPHFSIFLLPESLDILKERLLARGGMTEQSITERLTVAQKEIAVANEYDYSLINAEGKMAETVDILAKIITKKLAE